jgi:hypothetical protein
MRTQAADNHKQLCRLLWLFAIVLAASSLAMAQSSTITARTPGTPAGSYKLGDADAVNMFTGNLNYHLPLLEVGGRGEARTSLGIVIEAQVDYREVEIPEQGNVTTPIQPKISESPRFCWHGELRLSVVSNQPVMWQWILLDHLQAKYDLCRGGRY